MGGLADLQRCAHDTVIARVQRDLQRDDELRDDRQDLGTTGPALLQKVKHLRLPLLRSRFSHAISRHRSMQQIATGS